MCEHNRIQGDNYGETCIDCGEVLAGYGYFAEGSRECLHQFLPYDDEYEVCTFCETFQKKTKDADKKS